MLENAVYSILMPEGYASILWRNNDRADIAAEKMKLTSVDLKCLAMLLLIRYSRSQKIFLLQTWTNCAVTFVIILRFFVKNIIQRKKKYYRKPK